MYHRLILITCTVIACCINSRIYASIPSGQSFQIAVSSPGLYELSYSDARQLFGINQVAIDITSLKLYGKPGGTIQQNHRPDQSDIIQIPFTIVGNDDLMLTQGEKLLFYLDGPNKIEYDYKSEHYRVYKNPYALLANYYFQFNNLPLEASIIKESAKSKPLNPSAQSVGFQYYAEDKVNLLSLNPTGQGGGQKWYGDEISNNGQIPITRFLSLNQTATKGALVISTAVRTDNRADIIKISDDSGHLILSFRPTVLGDPEARYADAQERVLEIENINNTTLEFIRSSTSSRAWIDQIEFSFTQSNLLSLSESLFINSAYAIAHNHDGYMIRTLELPTVWDISNPSIFIQKNVFQDNDEFSFKLGNTDHENFLCFVPTHVFPTPSIVGSIISEDLSCLACDMIILYHPMFTNAAARLAAHRSQYENLQISLVNINDILLQYGSGQPDPDAIRAFVRKTKKGNPLFEYLCLFGDASYDYRGVDERLPAENFIPTYQTPESLDPLQSFPTDDYYVIEDETSVNLRGNMDIAIGRIIARTVEDAEAVVNKIIRYDNNRDIDRSWISRVAFFADDEDNNLHINDIERISNELSVMHPHFSQEKVYWDAFRQVAAPGGNRYPDARRRLNEIVQNGALVMNYIGHGGPRGWSQERVLDISDLPSWDNINRLPLIITATCTFTSFDDPSVLSAGELVFTNPRGGAIALFSTVRAVFASQNFRLNRSVFRNLFEKENGRYLPLGEIMRRAKNDPTNDNINTRKFFLIGDPAMRLTQATHHAVVTKINDIELKDENVQVTVGAFDELIITGQLSDLEGNQSYVFDNQVLEMVIADKNRVQRTLANDPGSFTRPFFTHGPAVFRGKATVNNGQWKTSFIMPSDIDYTIGQGRIMLSIANPTGDIALGFNNQLLIGGSNPNPPIDNNGPDIDLGIQHFKENKWNKLPPNIIITAEFYDQSGINIAGQAIGHEIIGWINNDIADQHILNDLFEPSPDDFTRGRMTIPLSSLSNGEHTYNIRAFDIFNNPTTSSITFTVDDRTAGISELEAWQGEDKRIYVDLLHSIGDRQYELEARLFSFNGSLISEHIVPATSRLGRIMVDFRGPYVSTDLLPCLLTVAIRDRNSRLLSPPAAKKMLLLK